MILLTIEPPDLRRLSKESFGTPASPSTAALPFTGSSKVGQKVISKMKIGGKIIGAATKSTIDKLGTSTGDKRSSGDIHYSRGSSEGFRDSPGLQQRPSPQNRTSGTDSPVIGRSEGLSQGEFNKQGTLRYPEPGSYIPSAMNQEGSRPIGLGLSTSSQPYSPDVNSFTSFSQMQLPAATSESPIFYPSPGRREERPQTLVTPSVVMPKKEGTPGSRHGFSASFSGDKVSKLSGQTTDPKSKRQSDSEYPSSSSPQQSPKQKSKFSRFVSDISQSTLAGPKPNQSGAAAPESPPPPPPPDKSQFRATSEGSGRLKGFFTDLSSRDISGNRPSDKQPSPRGPVTSPRPSKTSPRTPDERTSGTGGFKGFLSEISKRDLTGQTEQDRIAAARRRQQELAQVPAQPVVYDESASDWEVKLGTMEDVLPHIRRDVLVSSLKDAGGDEQRAIGLAVIRSR